MTKKFDVGPDSARIGLIQYNNRPTKEFEFLDDSDEIGVKLTHLEYNAGGTMTGKAMKFAYENYFKNVRKVDGQKVNQALVVITDGKSSDRVDIISKKLKKKGVNVLALGYNSSDKDQLLDIAGGDEGKVFQGQTIQSLTSFNDQMVKKICKLGN